MTNFLTLQPNALAEYQDWLSTIKQRIVTVRLRIALAASRELILFYWELGAMIAQLSADLQKAFPEIKGLSASNLKYCLRFFQFYSGAPDTFAPDSAVAPFGQQPVDQMPWGHNIQIFTKCGSVAEARFYIEQTLEQGWSRDVLALQLTRAAGIAGRIETRHRRLLYGQLQRSGLRRQARMRTADRR